MITDGELVLGESAAIIEYIITRYGNGRLLLKADDPDYANFLFWFHFANGSMMPSRMVELVSTLVGSAAQSGLMSALTARSDRAFDMLESRLGQVAFLAGTPFTAADIMMVFSLTTMRKFAPRDLSPYPNILAYLQRIAARQAFQRAMAKADPGYNLLLS